MLNAKCLCTNCSTACNACRKVELAINGKLMYVYLKNGNKIAYSCHSYKARSSSDAKPSGVFLGREGLLKIVS